MPATFERRWEDNPAHDNYYPESGTNRIVYKEGVFIGYRGYEKNQIQPLFPFGFGLSYTTFKYSNLAVKPGPPSSAPDFEVTFDVTNTGTLPGAAVSQVYVSQKRSSVPRPHKELKAFAKVFLKPGETRTVSVPLNARSFSYYDANGKQWRAEAGAFGVQVGNSSQDIQLEKEIALPKEFLSK